MTTRLTLEQLRAQNAWKAASAHADKSYANLAKGLPALVMGSGLLQVLMFLHEKGSKDPGNAHKQLCKDLTEWLAARHGLPVEFQAFIPKLMAVDAQTFRDVTAEAFAWLRWMRQIAAAVSAAGDGKGF